MAEKTTRAYTLKLPGDPVALPHGQSHDSSFHLTVAAALKASECRSRAFRRATLESCRGRHAPARDNEALYDE